jgi:hypothetical protein
MVLAASQKQCPDTNSPAHCLFSFRPSGAEAWSDLRRLTARVEEVAEKTFPGRELSPQRLKPRLKRRRIAAVNRCATQNQTQQRVFPQPLELVALPY